MGKKTKKTTPEHRGSNGSNHGHERKTTMELLYAEDPNSVIRIRFDRESLEYLPGETITGNVVFLLLKPVQLKKVTIAVVGTGRTSWAVAVGNKKKQLDVAHASTESYIDTEFTVTDTVETVTKKEFPFSYVLPNPPLPSTYIDAYGSITYVMKVTADTDQPGDLEKLKCMGAFLINGVYDLNEDPLLNQRAELYDHKTVGCCCIRTGRVEMCIQLHHRGFLVGDKISWIAIIENKSTSRVKQVTARLIQHALFHATGDIKQDEKPIVTVNAGAIKEKGRETWAGSLNIPISLPSTTSAGGSNLIVVNYALEFEVEVAGCTKNLKAQIPIAIGTVELAKRDSMAGVVDATATMNYGKDKAKPVEQVPSKASKVSKRMKA